MSFGFRGGDNKILSCVEFGILWIEEDPKVYHWAASRDYL
jgi:hypothetical protein